MKSNNPEFIKKRFLEKLPIFAAANYFDTDHIEIDVEYDKQTHTIKLLIKMIPPKITFDKKKKK